MTQYHRLVDTPSTAPSTQNVRVARFVPALTVILAGTAGVLASRAGLRPTGEPHDAALVGVLAGVTVWCAATAPSWLITLWCGAIAALSISGPVAVTLGLAAVVGLLFWPRAEHELVRCAAAGAALVGSAYLPPFGRFGNTALVALTFAASAALLGALGKPARVRRAVLLLAAPVLAWGVAAAVATGAALLQARDQLTEAEQGVRSAVDALQDGDFTTARTVISAARDDAEAARRVANERFGWLGRYVPVVAQHRRAADAVVTSAADLLRDVDRVVQQLPRGRLTGKSGRINTGELAALGDALSRLSRTTAAATVATTASTTSPWLYGPAQRQLLEVSTELGDRQGDMDRLGAAMRVLPGLLGDDRPRRYLVIFITPSEARTLGGFMGSYATIVADQGKISLETVGRTGDLYTYAKDHPEALIIDRPQSYIDRYLAFGTGGNGTPANVFWWQRFTLSPDFPSVAQVAANLFPKATGQYVDGVLSLDPHALAGLLNITGPITLPSIDRQLSSADAEQFLSRDQYLLIPERGNDARIELLGEAAEITFNALLETPQLDVSTLLDALRPEVDGRHLMAWSPDGIEEAVYHDAGMDGAFTLPEGDALLVANNNSSGNKIDIFLHRQISYQATYDRATGALTATVDITLTNEAPTEGLPDYLIANAVGDAFGTTRSYVMTYSRAPFTGATLDGEPIDPVPPGTGTELGWPYVEWQVVIPSGGSTTLHYELAGALPAGQPYSLTVRAQPTARADDVTVNVRDLEGNDLVSWSGATRTDLVLEQNP